MFLFQFGPYSGTFYNLKEYQEHKAAMGGESGYAWEIKDPDLNRVVGYVDPGKNPDPNKHWMSMVNTANNEHKQNVLAEQHRGGIYYHTIQTIGRGGELRTDYDKDYRKELKIDEEKYVQYPHDENWKEEGAKCSHCGRGFVSQKDVDEHVAKASEAGHAGGCAALRKKKNQEKVDDGLATQICDVCGHGFKTACKLKEHKKLLAQWDKKYKKYTTISGEHFG